MTARPAVRFCARVCALQLAALLTLGGCASTPHPQPDPADPAAANPGTANLPPDPVDPIPDPAIDPDPPPVANGPSVGQRAQSAVEGMVMGAVVGAQFGPFGAAVVTSGQAQLADRTAVRVR